MEEGRGDPRIFTKQCTNPNLLEGLCLNNALHAISGISPDGALYWRKVSGQFSLYSSPHGKMQPVIAQYRFFTLELLKFRASLIC